MKKPSRFFIIIGILVLVLILLLVLWQKRPEPPAPPDREDAMRPRTQNLNDAYEARLTISS